ncbi:sugar ABC transporter substrate-binding protein [Chloroflexi bacterium TSY]|nr:sugar ABC transporter substrate-binding protein [Chloroflexi bacterium TSY]
MSNQAKWSRRDFLRISAVACVGTTLVACVPATQAPDATESGGDAPAEDQVELTVWHVNEDELDPIIAAFEEQNASISVAFTYFPWGDFFEKLETAYAAGTPPDVHRQDDDEIPFFAQRDVLLPLEEVLQEKLNPDELFWDAVQSTNISGHLWVSIPAMRVGNLVYNKTMFEEAGVTPPPTTYPSEEWTWDTFMETAAQLSQSNEMIFGFGGADNADFITSMGRSQGGRILDDGCLEFLMHEAPMANAMQAAADMMQVTQSAVDPETSEAFGGRGEMFNLGQLGMTYASTRQVPPEDVEFEWDVAGLPVFSGHDPIIFAAIECYAVPKATEKPDAATAFAASLMDEETQRILAETKNIIPINRQAATEVWAAPENVPASRSLLVDALAYGRTLPFAVGFGRVQDIAWPAIGEVARGEKSAADAMTEVKPQVDDVLQEVGGCLGEAA